MIIESLSLALRGNAETLERLVKLEEALTGAGLSFNSLQDPGLIPKLIGADRPDLVGRYVLYSIKSAEIQNRVREVTKLTIDQKREAIKELYSLADEAGSISKELE